MIYDLSINAILALAALCFTAGFGIGGFIFFFVGVSHGAEVEVDNIIHDTKLLMAAELRQVLDDTRLGEYTEAQLDMVKQHWAKMYSDPKPVEFKFRSTGFRVGADGMFHWFDEETDPDQLRQGGAI